MKNKKLSHKPNLNLLICSGLFILTGILAIATASPPFAINAGMSSNYFLFHQLLYGFLPGIFLAIIAFFTPLEFIKKYSLWIFIFTFALMFLAFIPGIGINEGGASRWVNLFGIGFQPSEFLKIGTIIYLSAILSDEKRKNQLMMFFIIFGLVGLSLFLQSDLSTLVTIFAACFAIFVSAKTKIKDICIILGTVLSIFLILITTSTYRMKRVVAMFNPTENVSDTAYHINQALISIGSGGLSGSGLGLSAQKFGFIPEAMSDSIFTIFAEELGFIGCFFLIFIFIYFIISAFSVSKKANQFGKLLATGIGTWIVFQACINISAMTGVMPISGTPLPFLSYGGTHLIVELIALGLLLNVSRGINLKE